MTYTNANWTRVSGNPDAFKGERVALVGKVFTEPEYDKTGVAMQMWADAAHGEGNTIVYFSDPNFDVKTDDYVRVTGTIGDQFKGENAMGGEVTAATINADSAKVVDALAAAPQAVRTVSVGKRVAQYGISITVHKVEYADTETRVYVTFANSSSAKASIYSYSAKAIQGSRPYSVDQGLTEYPQPESDLLPKTKTSGVVVFKPMKPDKATRFVFEGYSENYNITLKPFSVTVK